jgi:adenylate cyclase
MGGERLQRRLSAILAADVASYTRLVEQDTDGTVAAWKAACDDIIDPTISEHSGRIVKLTGDGFLVEFQTVQDAVKCAIAMQDGLAEGSLEFRMGINLGDVIDDGKDIHGEGVNIAARIEALAEPGGICISGGVFDQVRNRLDHHFEDLGEHEVKHVSAPVRVYAIRHRDEPTSVQATKLPLTIPDKPSIVILPFDNLSGDIEQDYFADGMVEDIITGLSRIKWLFVIARNSSFVYKGKSVDVTQVGRELGVRYVLEGSVRKSSNHVRVTGQLIEAESNRHVWADRYDRTLDDIFAIQDELTMSVVAAIEPSLRQAEIERVKRKRPENLDAYDLALRAIPHVYPAMPDGAAMALPLLERAIEKEPDYALAHGFAAWSH